MKRDRDSQRIDLTGRIKSLEQFSGSLVARHPEGADHGEVPINEAPPTRVPHPRRSRVFLRGGGGGHGVFADLTLTAPPPHVATD